MPSGHPGQVDLLVASYEKVEFKQGQAKFPSQSVAVPDLQLRGEEGHFFVCLPWWLFFLVQFLLPKIRGVWGPRLNLPLSYGQTRVQVFSRPVIGWDVMDGVYQDLAIIGTRHNQVLLHSSLDNRKCREMCQRAHAVIAIKRTRSFGWDNRSFFSVCFKQTGMKGVGVLYKVS